MRWIYVISILSIILTNFRVSADDGHRQRHHRDLHPHNRCAALMAGLDQPFEEFTPQQELLLIRNLLSGSHNQSTRKLIQEILEKRLTRSPEIFYQDLIQHLSSGDLDYQMRALRVYVDSLREILTHHASIPDSYRKMWKEDLEQIWAEELYEVLISVRSKTYAHIDYISQDPIYSDRANFNFESDVYLELMRYLHRQEYLLDEAWMFDAAERDRIAEHYQASRNLENLWIQFQQLEKGFASTINLVQLTTSDTFDTQLFFYQSLVYAQALLGESEASVVELERRYSSSEKPLDSDTIEEVKDLIFQIEHSQHVLIGMHRTMTDQNHDYFIWKSLKNLAKISNKLKQFIIKNPDLFQDAGTHLAGRIDYILEDDLTRWAQHVPEVSRKETASISKLILGMRTDGYLESEVPSEWKSNLNSYQAWRTLKSKLEARNTTVIQGPINALSFDRIRNFVQSISRDSEKDNPDDFYSSESNSVKVAQDKLSQMFEEIKSSEIKIKEALKNRRSSSGTRFLLHKRQETLWRLRRFLAEEVRSISSAAETDSFERKLLEEIQSYQAPSNDFLLYLGADSLAEFEKREAFLRSIRHDSTKFQVEVLERIGSETDFERFKAAITP